MFKKSLSLVLLFALVLSFLFMLPVKDSTAMNPLKIDQVMADEKVEANKGSSEESDWTTNTAAITWTILVTAVVVVGGINIARVKKRGNSIKKDM